MRTQSGQNKVWGIVYALKSKFIVLDGISERIAYDETIFMKIVLWQLSNERRL